MYLTPLQRDPWACVVPAYNEAPRLGAVLTVLAECSWLTEVVVVDDGSTDETAEVAEAVIATLHPIGPAFQLIRHPKNSGKATALITGFAATTAEQLLMVDADLLGFTPEHLALLALPIATGAATMTTGLFKGGRLNTDAAHVVAPGLSGQRALTRTVWNHLLASIDNPDELAYGVEEALEDLVKRGLAQRELVEWRGMSHVTKEEKVGLIKGWEWRLKMYREVLKSRIAADWKAIHHPSPPSPSDNEEERR